MKMQLKTLAFATGLLLVGSLSSAAPLDSNAFTYKYEGNVYNSPGLPGYTENSTTSGTAPSLLTFVPGATDGNVLSFAGDIASGGGFFSSTEWPGHPINDSTGWTVEFRVRIGTETAPGKAANGAFGLTTNDGSTNAGQPFGVGQSKFGAFGNVFDTSDNTDDFHVFRLAQDLSDATTYAWRDGVPVGSYAGFQYNYGTPEMYWGDGSGDIGGPTVLVDYVRFTPGAFEPVPEPMSMMLLAWGAVPWLRRKRSR